jgi:hypothetical protein
MFFRRTMFPYLIAVGIASLLIGLGALFIIHTKQQLNQHLTEQKTLLKQQAAEGKLPPEWQGVNIDAIELSQLQMQLPPDLHARLDIADALSDWWFVLIPIVVGVCLLVAFLGKRLLSS